MKAVVGQVTVPERQFVGMGHVTEFSDKRMVIRTGVAVPQLPFWRKGLAASVNFVFNDTVYSGAALVDTFSATTIALQIQSVNKSMDARGSSRKLCVVDLAYRIMRADRSFTPWREGRVVDISIGGIGLIIPTSRDTPHQMDLQFILPFESTAGVTAGHGADAPDSTDNRISQRTRLEAAQVQNKANPIRCRGRVVHSIHQSDGTTKLGLSFVALDPYGMLHVHNFMME
jgi:hypothetical protein